MEGSGRKAAFPRAERLKRSAAISAVFRHGACVSTGGARLFFMPTDHAGVNRIAFAFSRKFGCAAQRNRARRLGREAYRHIRTRLKTGFDLVLLVYPDETADAGRRTRQLRALLEKARLVEREMTR
jgi:ribonuclease P protein component